MKHQHLIFCLLGPLISLTMLTAEAFITSGLQSGFGTELGMQFGRILSNYLHPAFVVLYLVTMLPAFLSSWLFTKMLASSSHSGMWPWFSASIAAMAIGPALLALLIFNHLLGSILATLIPAGLAVVVCGVLSRRNAIPAPQTVF